MEPRRDADWLRRKLQDQSRRIEALENGRRLDPEGGTGLGRPWIPVGPVWITGNAFWGSSTSASFVKVAYIKGVVQHPSVLVQFQWRIIDAATTGDYRIVQTRGNGETKVNTIGSFAGPNSVGIEVPFVVACPSFFPELVTIEIQAARTAGTGNVEAHVDAVMGCGLEDNPFTVLP
jgi:hypothetical protein